MATVLVAFAIVDGKPDPYERREGHERAAAGDGVDRACDERGDEDDEIRHVFLNRRSGDQENSSF